VAEIRILRGISARRGGRAASVSSPQQFGVPAGAGGIVSALITLWNAPHRGAFGRARGGTDAGRLAAPAETSVFPRTGLRKDDDMGFFSKDIKSLDDLFVHTLRDVYYAEKEIKNALPDMIDKATNPMLKAGFEQHLQETEGHIERVEQVFEMHGVKAKGVDCPAIDGILEEASEVAGEVDDKQVLDAALIAAAQAVEHYEITRYGTLVEWAKQLGREDCAAVLKKNLDEEKATDKKLTALAESKINLQAAE